MDEKSVPPDDRDLYLSICPQCRKRKNSYWFRLNDVGQMMCPACAAKDPFCSKPERSRPSSGKREPPARWVERKYGVPKVRKVRTGAVKGRERNRGRPDVMVARVPGRRGSGFPVCGNTQPDR